MVHIPADLETRVRRSADNFQQAARLLKQLSQQGRERIAKTKAQRSSGISVSATSRKAANPQPPHTTS